ncbi:hypothetical protein HG535_0G01250 [Zygotorulaspora mrakii]|uniref:Uncharacterized protein n=1 Tax=Zygotorulaspora mrakii TaxID=42260 RepID=A0A7H9B6E1_ZYGMR|nr:uncharacterized protein HG535_0G01250 [Zygotorulaspora mrakii]QLG74241.1 hypothetical protein HG535_0G01250 [Zygotorulaspora mrakii]
MRGEKFVQVLNLLFLLGAGLLGFFLILSGGKSGGVLDGFYWFEADTSGFNDAPQLTRWYNYDWCAVRDNQVTNCSSRAPATAFSPRDNFGRSNEMPTTFLDNRNAYYYLSRVGWAMLLIGLFYIVLSIIPAIVLLFKSSVAMHIWHNLAIWAALLFVLLSACLYTGCYVKARSGFNSEGRHSKLGAKMFAFIWTTSFLLMWNAAWAVAGAVLSKRDRYNAYGRGEVYGTGATYNSSSSDGHMDKSTYNSEQQHNRGRFFTRLGAKNKSANPATTAEPDEVEYTTTDYVTQPATEANRTEQVPSAV